MAHHGPPAFLRMPALVDYEFEGQIPTEGDALGHEVLGPTPQASSAAPAKAHWSAGVAAAHFLEEAGREDDEGEGGGGAGV